MSENAGQLAIAADAEAVETQAVMWFRRRSFWEWREEDQADFDLWLAASPSHEIAYWRLEGAWSRSERLSALHKPERDTAPSRRSFLAFARNAVAVSAIASVIGAATWSYLFQPHESVFQTSLGGHRVLSFADGTEVDLNTNTVLRARIDNTHRRVELVSGEAYFKVHHDAKNPFVVMAAGHRVVDRGTAFAIRASKEEIRVSLLEGRARIEASGGLNRRAVDLAPGDVATASATSLSVSRKSVVELSNDIAWRRGLLVFKYMPLYEAVAEINRYNDEKLVIADASIANRTIYGTIPTQGIQAFVRVTTGALGLHVEKRGTEFVISR
jgi:transmembrane sensor